MHLSKNIASLSVLLICTVAGNPISFTENNELKRDVPTPVVKAAAEDLCSDPIGAVLSTLDCIEREDAICAARSYADSFKKLHNGAVVNEGSVGIVMWTGSFVTLDFVLDVNHVAEIGPNQISIRYEEIVTTASGYPLILDSPSTEYPFSQTFVQHEHALVTVEGDCKISLWDQYGDDMEQVDVETAAADLFKAYIFGLLSPEKMGDPLNHDMRSIYLP